MNRVRRALLEIWAIVPLALIVGFMGPFGTYSSGDLFMRFGHWWAYLMGAYVVVRPTMILWHWIARETRLPVGSVMLWGMIGASFPMAFLWQVVGGDEIGRLGGYAGELPFTFLCSLGIFGVAWWAHRADTYLQRRYGTGRLRTSIDMPIEQAFEERETLQPIAAPRATVAHAPSSRPRLYARLSPRFEGEILALESEDHYVRVHGRGPSELLLLRLRDAIAEMDGSPGEQTHRSWWIARDAVADVIGAGRHRQILLVNGVRAPVARDSVDRLQRSGFLPATPGIAGAA